MRKPIPRVHAILSLEETWHVGDLVQHSFPISTATRLDSTPESSRICSLGGNAKSNLGRIQLRGIAARSGQGSREVECHVNGNENQPHATSDALQFLVRYVFAERSPSFDYGFARQQYPLFSKKSLNILYGMKSVEIHSQVRTCLLCRP